MEAKKELKNKAKLLEPVLRIGKNGLTDGVIAEIEKLLKKKKLIKIKLLRNFMEDKNKKEVAHLLSEQTSSEVIDLIGNVVVLYKTPSIENNLNVKKHNTNMR